MKSITLGLVFVLAIAAQNGAQELTADEILGKSDSVVNAPEDQELLMKLVLIDNDGDKKERDLRVLQKGSDMRMVKFLSPADQKGIAFLDLPNDMMYVYLPAFKKVRRIAGHIKSQNFAGTDFTYDDMATLSYSQEYDPSKVDETDEYYILELIPKEGAEKDYSRLKMWVRKDNFYPQTIEYFDKAGNLWKKSERSKIEMVDAYWVSREFEMTDLKENHTTKSLLEEVTFDGGLGDNLFTQRYLKR